MVLLTEFRKKKSQWYNSNRNSFVMNEDVFFLSELSTLICEKFKYPTRLTGKKLHIHSIINWRKIDDILINSKPKKAKLCYTQIYTLNTFSSRLLTLLPQATRRYPNDSFEKKKTCELRQTRYIKPEISSILEIQIILVVDNLRAKKSHGLKWK